MTKAANKAAYADSDGGKSGSQVAPDDSGFRARLAQAVGSGSQAEIARKAGLRPQMIGDYIAGRRSPGAESLFALADALQLDARWLLTGDAMRRITIQPEAEVVYLPRYDLFSFGEGERPSSIESVPVQREWLIRAARTDRDVWLTEMPTDALPEIARSGDTIICRFVDPPLQDGRVYVFLLDGRPIVRRVQVRPGGLVLKAGDPSVEPIELRGEEQEQLVPIARVLATISLQSA